MSVITDEAGYSLPGILSAIGRDREVSRPCLLGARPSRAARIMCLRSVASGRRILRRMMLTGMSLAALAAVPGSLLYLYSLI